MNQNYIIRNDTGTMIAKISGEVFGAILRLNMGFWRSYKAKNNPNGECYEISGDYHVTPDHMLTMYLWKGYIIIRD